MRVVLQRVSEASVTIAGEKTAAIGPGFLILLGIESSDTQEDIDWLAGKIARLRVFSDAEGAMNLSLEDSGGECLVVSQFTLHASTKKGNRPSFIRAARPEVAIPLYEAFVLRLEEEIKKKVETGLFGAMMEVGLINDGPVTIQIDSINKE
jgi:D-tyrosyl-tRNA(Tyr) deacylase